MKRYLLDTCAFIDMMFNPSQLSDRAAAEIEGNSELCVSIVSFWEIAIKQQIGKLGIGDTSAEDLERACIESGVSIIQTTPAQIDHIRKLPVFKDHGDPFDRLIISHAVFENIPVITSDKKFKNYDINVVW